MLDPTKGDTQSVNVSFSLDSRQRQVLSAFIQQEGWDIMQKLMESEVREFNVAVANTPVSKPDDVLAKHKVAVAASQFYQGLINRVREELGLHNYQAAHLGTMANPENNNAVDFD
jgi:hypothetical protein